MSDTGSEILNFTSIEGNIKVVVAIYSLKSGDSITATGIARASESGKTGRGMSTIYQVLFNYYLFK